MSSAIEHKTPSFPHYVGECIYCGSRDRLSDEHVVPLGLSGLWILEKASCAACAKITSSFERDVLRDQLMPLRAKLSLKTRRKSERPSTFPMEAVSAQGSRPIDVPIAEHPGAVIMPIFPPARALTGKGPTSGIDIVGSVTISPDAGKWEQVRAYQQASGLKIKSTYRPASFARLLAKIAYSASVACGWRQLVPETAIVEAILGRTNELGVWVGSNHDKDVNPMAGHHAIAIEPVGELIVAYVRLFGVHQAPEYHVVLGRGGHAVPRATS